MESLKKIFKEKKLDFILFSTFGLAFLLMEQILSDNISREIASEFVLHVASNIILFTAIGYISFNFIYKLKSNKKVIDRIIEIIFMIVMFLGIISKNEIQCIILSIISTFSLGYIGAKVHYVLSQDLGNSNIEGRTIGYSLAIALIIQQIINNITSNVFLKLISMYLAAVILFITINRVNTNKKLKEYNTEKIEKTYKIVPIIISILISIIIGLQDGAITNLSINGKINLYGISRIFYILGGLSAGYFSDYKKGKYLSISAICVILISIGGIVFLNNSNFYDINASTMLFLGGFYTVYLTLTFINIAPLTKQPMIWAGMGRIIRSIAKYLLYVPSTFYFARYGQNWMIFTSVIISIIIIMIVYIEKDREYITLVEKSKETVKKVNVKEFLDKYNFTAKEKEVCNLILIDNKITKEVADELEISERSVQRHLKNIYTKTNTKSRNELYNLFYNVK